MPWTRTACTPPPCRSWPLRWGGLLFGAGMVLTRGGCISRLTVLTGSGNLRALFVLLVVAIFAHATMKGGLLAPPLRTGGLSSITIPTPPAVPGPGLAWALVVALLVAVFAWRIRAPKGGPVLAAMLIGLLVPPLGWFSTGLVLFDEFDPIALDSLSFTRPLADSLFWSIASSAVPAGFGTGLLGGTLAGAALLAILSGRFKWQSFESASQTGRYLLGGALMGIGGGAGGRLHGGRWPVRRVHAVNRGHPCVGNHHAGRLGHRTAARPG